MWSSSQNWHHRKFEAQGGALQPREAFGVPGGDSPVQLCPNLFRELVPRRWQTCFSAVLALGAKTSFTLWDAGVCPGPVGQVSARLCSFWRPQERSHFLAFSNFEKLPTLLGLWLLASSVMTDICLCPIPSLLASLTYGPCDNTGPTCIIQKHLNPMTSAKSFLSCEVPWLHSWLIWPGYRATGWAALGSCPPGSGATSQQGLLHTWPLPAPALPSTRAGSGQADRDPSGTRFLLLGAEQL